MLSKLLGMFKSGPEKSSVEEAAHAPPTYLPRGAFADAYADYVRQHAPEITVERADDGVRLAWPDGGTMSQFLNNAYTNYRRDVDALENIFETELASARQAGSSMGADKSLDLSLVMPVVKTEQWLATVVQQRGEDTDPKHDLVVQPLVPGLILAYAQDLPSSLEYVKRGDLDGIDEAALHDRAVANLKARGPDMTVRGAEGRYRAVLDGFFDVSLVLVAERWVPQLDLAGDPVFALPSRDQLMVCGSEDQEAVTELAELAMHMAADSAYAVSSHLLVLRGGTLQAL